MRKKRINVILIIEDHKHANLKPFLTTKPLDINDYAKRTSIH